MACHVYSVRFCDGFVKLDCICSADGHFDQLLRTCHNIIYGISSLTRIVAHIYNTMSVLFLTVHIGSHVLMDIVGYVLGCDCDDVCNRFSQVTTCTSYVLNGF